MAGWYYEWLARFGTAHESAASQQAILDELAKPTWAQGHGPKPFITGEWSVEYPPVVYGTAEESRDSQRALLKAACAETNIFPAAAMRDSAFR